MNPKLALVALLAVGALSAGAQPTNCSQVDWQNNTNSNFRLRIANYTNDVTLPAEIVGGSIWPVGGEGSIWQGTFTRVDTTSSNIRYYAEAGTISVFKLETAFIEWVPSQGTWWLTVQQAMKVDFLDPYILDTWEGCITNTSPIGAFTRQNGEAQGPATLTVECFERKPTDCQIYLKVWPSPYTDTTNVFTNICNPLTEVRHWDSAYNDSVIITNQDGTFDVPVKDGDFVGIGWPNCCDTGWGIAAEGDILSVVDGELSVAGKVTLCIPNSEGFRPVQQVVYTEDQTGGYNWMVPPYTLMAFPTGGTNGYNGCVWQAHIKCIDCELGGQSGHSPKCKVEFEVKYLLRCANPRWIANVAGDPRHPKGVPYISPMEVITQWQVTKRRLLGGGW